MHLCVSGVAQTQRDPLYLFSPFSFSFALFLSRSCSRAASLSLSLYVYMFAYVDCAYAHTPSQIHTHAYIHTCMQDIWASICATGKATFIRVHLCICAYTYTDTRINMHTHAYINNACKIHGPMYAQLEGRQTNVFTCMHMCTCIHVSRVHASTHIHTR